MKSRMELWKDYRNEIEKNIALQQAVRQSDERYRVLEGRLLKVYPRYFEKYVSKLTTFKVDINQTPSAPKISLDDLEKIEMELEIPEQGETLSMAAIDQISFEDAELKEAIEKIRLGRADKAEYLDIVKENTTSNIRTNKIEMVKLQKVNLGGDMKKYRIAIDGPSGSGKSTAAKLIAKRYGYTYINTGLIYRAIALNAINKSINVSEEADNLIALLEPNMIELMPNEVVKLHGKDVTKAVRGDIVSQTASKVAAINEVRNYALEISKHYAQIPGTVMDGRDTTFRIMPDADLKIFLDTAPEVRAARRVEQNKVLGFSTDYETILKEIVERDNRDRNRKVDPLHVTEGAHLIDASDMQIEEVVSTIDNLLKKLR